MVRTPMGGLLLAISVAEGKISSNIALAIIDVTIPLLKDVKTQAPKAICELAPPNVSARRSCQLVAAS